MVCSYGALKATHGQIFIASWDFKNCHETDVREAAMGYRAQSITPVKVLRQPFPGG